MHIIVSCTCNTVVLDSRFIVPSRGRRGSFGNLCRHLPNHPLYRWARGIFRSFLQIAALLSPAQKRINYRASVAPLVIHPQLAIPPSTRPRSLGGDISALGQWTRIRFLKFLCKSTVAGNGASSVSLSQALSSPERPASGIFAEVGSTRSAVLCPG